MLNGIEAIRPSAGVLEDHSVLFTTTQEMTLYHQKFKYVTLRQWSSTFLRSWPTLDISKYPWPTTTDL